MPIKLEELPSRFSEGHAALVLEGRIPERGQDDLISVTLTDTYDMVALSIKAHLSTMMVEIGNNYVVRVIR